MRPSLAEAVKPSVGVLLAGDQLLRVEELTVRAGANLIHDGRLKILGTSLMLREDAKANMWAMAGIRQVPKHNWHAFAHARLADSTAAKWGSN